jgi:hypothetical protein
VFLNGQVNKYAGKYTEYIKGMERVMYCRYIGVECVLVQVAGSVLIRRRVFVLWYEVQVHRYAGTVQVQYRYVTTSHHDKNTLHCALVEFFSGPGHIRTTVTHLYAYTQFCLHGFEPKSCQPLMKRPH